MIPEWVVIVYPIVGGGLFFFSGMITLFESGRAQRNAARLVLISPVWPVLPILGLALTVRALWRAADLSHKK